MSEAAPEATKDQKMSAARSAAITRLREAHQQEFNSYLVDETKARGLDWSPRKTPEERAAEEMADLIKRFPHLAEQVPGRTVPTVPDASPPQG